MRPLLLSGEYQILVVKDFSLFARRNSRGLVKLEDSHGAGVRIIGIGALIGYPTYDGWGYKKIANYLTETGLSTPRTKERIEDR